MALFKIRDELVVKLEFVPVGKERYIQNLFEKNLETILNIDFLASEYSTSFGGRIDSLGIDRNGAPVIVEYKRNQNDNVINQGLSYLKWLLDHKADFEILCRNKKIGREIDWASPRVVCVAESYNKFDLDTAELLPMKIELLKYRVYKDQLLYVEPESKSNIRISTRKIFEKGEKQQRVTRLQKEYHIEDHLRNASKNATSLFLQIKEFVMGLDESIVEEAKAKYIAYKLTTNFVDLVIKKNAIKVFLNIPSGKLDDPDKMARDLVKPKKIGHWGNGDYEVIVNTEWELDPLFELIKQSYNYNK